MPTKEIEGKARRQEKSLRLTKETLKSCAYCLLVVEIGRWRADVVVVADVVGVS